jgi:hypothetical protein
MLVTKLSCAFTVNCGETALLWFGEVFGMSGYLYG